MRAADVRLATTEVPELLAQGPPEFPALVPLPEPEVFEGEEKDDQSGLTVPALAEEFSYIWAFPVPPGSELNLWHAADGCSPLERAEAEHPPAWVRAASAATSRLTCRIRFTSSTRPPQGRL